MQIDAGFFLNHLSLDRLQQAAQRIINEELELEAPAFAAFSTKLLRRSEAGARLSRKKE